MSNPRIGAAVNTPGQKPAEEALRESEERFRALITATSDIIYRMSPDWSEILQVQGKNFVPTTGEPIHDWLQKYIPTDDQPQVVAAIKQAIRTKSVFELEHRVHRVDGTVGWTFSRAVPILDANDEIIEWFGTASDVTSRKMAEMELAANLEKLKIETAERMRVLEALREKEYLLMQQSRQAALGEMISYIAHQWRQPLNVLGLSIQGLGHSYEIGEVTKELVDESVTTAMELIRHMSKTIDDFSNYFRLDKEKTRFNVKETVENTLGLVMCSFNIKSIAIDVIVNGEPEIYGNRNEFIQVLLNILNNAGDALTERHTKNPRVTVTLGCENGHSVLTITDNAGGIPEENIGRIFNPYFTTKDPHIGTGVGLYMSKNIIEKNMGGKLTVRNVAHGAEFRIEV